MDSFIQEWASENNWLVPPIYLDIRTIQHLIHCKSQRTLIVPMWFSAAYWPMIFKKNTEYRCYVKYVMIFYNPHGIYVKGSNERCIFGTEPFRSPVLLNACDM